MVGSMSGWQAAALQSILAFGTFFRGKNNFPLPLIKEEQMSRVMRKPTICICEKDADQLRGNREADQPLCFRYLDSTIPLLPKYKISSL